MKDSISGLVFTFALSWDIPEKYKEFFGIVDTEDAECEVVSSELNDKTPPPETVGVEEL